MPLVMRELFQLFAKSFFHSRLYETAGILAALAAFLLTARPGVLSRRSRAFLLPPYFVLPILLLNPLLMPPLLEIFPRFMLERLNILLPVELVLGVVIASLGRRVFRAAPRFTAILIPLVFVAGLTANVTCLRAHYHRPFPHPQLGTFEGFVLHDERFADRIAEAVPLLAFMRESIPRHAVVAADEELSQFVYSFTECFLLSYKSSHTYDTVRDQEERLALRRRIAAGSVDRAGLDEFAVDYALVAAETVLPSELFALLYRDAHHALYRVRRDGDGDGARDDP
jgi:hypothetical protein